MKWSLVLFFILCVFGMPCICPAQTEDFASRLNREPLHGIKRITLSGIVAEKDIVQDGLNTEAIKISMENKLRIAGLKIVPMVSFLYAPTVTAPQLITVEIETLKIKDERTYCYTVRFIVSDYAVLIQDKKISGAFTVWEQQVLGYAGTSRLSEIQNTCDDLTDKFVNDWLKAKDEIPHGYTIKQGATNLLKRKPN
jgi:hypothetical protein